MDSGRDGAYQPIEQPRSEDSFCFANSFWATSDKKRPLEGNLVGIEIAKDGYDTLMNRMKAGTKTLEDLRLVYRERSAMEEEYSKKLYKLAKNSIGSGEVGHMERAIGQMKSELEVMGKAHADLAALLKSQDNQLGEFVSRRDGGRKLQQTSVEKAWKNKCSQEAYVSKAKQKYEADAMTINTMHAQAALIQGRELDKLQAKLDKTVQTVGTYEKEYSQFVKVLKETTAAWNEQWRVYCNTCQDQEEERLDFLKSRLWDWANSLSTVAMNEDESAERTRTALEQCDPRTDLKIFVNEFGTGRDIPDAPNYVDFGKQQTAQARQTYKTANFSRSSVRGGNLRHSPSGIDEIQRAFQSVPTSIAPPQEQSKSRSRSRSPEKQSFPTSNSHSSFAAPPPSPPKVDGNNLASRSSNNINNLSNNNNGNSRQEGSNSNNSSSRFVVSPSANPSARASADRGGAPNLPPKQGVVPASLFQRRQSQPSTLEAELPTSQSSNQIQNQHSSTPTTSSNSNPNQVTAEEDEDDDPITRAFNQLNSEISPPRNNRPSVGAVALPGMTPNSRQQQSSSQSQPQPQSSGMNSRQSQQNMSRSRSTQQDEFNNNGRRSTSPSPALMQPPLHDSVPAVISQYGQAFPGERTTNSSGGRPHSRQGSNASNRYSNGINLQSPTDGNGNNYDRSNSPTPVTTPFAGVGARGRSPSPQPFQQPQPHQQQQQQPQRASSPQPPSNYQSVRQPSFDQRYAGQVPPSTTPQQQPQHSTSNSYDGQRRGSAVSQRPPSQVGIPQQAYTQAPPNQVYGQQAYQQQPIPQAYQVPPPQQYSAPPPQQQQQQPPRQPSPSPSQYRQPSPAQVYQQQQQVPPSNYQQPPIQQSYAPPPVQYQPQQPQQQPQQQPLHHQQHQQQQQQQPPNMIRGVSANSAYGGVYNSPQQPQVAPSSVSSNYAPSRSPSTASSVAPPSTIGQSRAPTGQYSDDGKPILFYVTAIYSYTAAGPDEFSFSEGDVIAVNETDPDGWWHGTPVGLAVQGHIFPSNFTEILP